MRKSLNRKQRNLHCLLWHHPEFISHIKEPMTVPTVTKPFEANFLPPNFTFLSLKSNLS